MEIKVHNILHGAVNQAIDEMFSGMTVNDSTTGNYEYPDGSMVLPLSGDTLTGQRINIRQKSTADGEIAKKIYAEELLKQITAADNIKRVKGCTIGLAEAILAEFNLEANRGTLYGLLIVSEEGAKINILHPVVSMMIAAGEMTIPETFTLLIFPFPEKKGIHRKNRQNRRDNKRGKAKAVHNHRGYWNSSSSQGALSARSRLRGSRERSLDRG